jgi:predicted aspartyl protease
MSVLFHYPPPTDPPAPFALVELGSDDGSRTLSPTPARLDTGADRTVVPAGLISALALEAIAAQVCEGLGGSRVTLFLYRVQLRIVGLKPLLVDVLSAEGEPHILLGIDVLNQYTITLDGPKRTVTIEEH